MGILYVVATPIGNLDDITIRALKILFTVNGIACEDTRRTGQLLKLLRTRYEKLVVDEAIDIPDQRLISYYEQNEFRRIPNVITALKNDLNIALVSDAGTPAVSDPGFRLILECLKEGIKVVPVPGSSAVLTALVGSGMPPDKFLFIGYPPHKPGNRKQLFLHLLQAKEYLSSTIIMFEAPHKLMKTLNEMEEYFGNIEIVIARELTKVHEEFRRGLIQEQKAHFRKVLPKGEFVILFHL
jgi:16S rRNA (cytidine1402-2'-O)-methyltransferase